MRQQGIVVRQSDKFLKKNGNIHPVNLRANEIFGENDTCIRMFGVCPTTSSEDVGGVCPWRRTIKTKG
jgi:hypothetical protein